MSDGRLLLAATPLGGPATRPRGWSTRWARPTSLPPRTPAGSGRWRSHSGVRIAGRVVSLFDQNEAARVPALVDELRAGATVLAVTDAGMPSISDPGLPAGGRVCRRRLPVTCLPGPSAVTTALTVSGLPADRFCFDGFAPRKQAARRTLFASLAGEQRTCVFFESPRRLAECLRDAVEELGGERRAAVCRELTKTHEEVVRGNLAELAEWAANGVLGEITVVLAGATPRSDLDTLLAEVSGLTEGGMGVKDACARGDRRRVRVLRPRRGVYGCSSPLSRLGPESPRIGRCFDQAFAPLGVGNGVGGDAAADTEHGVARAVELDGADRHVQLGARDR